MSKRDWSTKSIALAAVGAFTLVFGALLIGYLLGYDLGKDHADTEYSGKYHDNYASEIIERECGRLDLASDEGHKCVEEAIQTSVEHQTAYADLKSQERMAFWAMLMGIFTGFTALVTFGGVVLVAFTLDATRTAAEYAKGMLLEARKTTDAANETIEASRSLGRDQSRAYVSVESVEFFWGGPKGQSPQCRVTIANSGQTPAKWFQARTSAAAPKINAFPDAFPAQDQLGEFGSRWGSISSGKELNFPVYLHEQAEEFGVCRNDGVNRPTNGFVLFGEVRYVTFFGEVFVSQFVFGSPHGLREHRILDTKTQQRGLIKIVEDTEEPIELSRLSFEIKTYDREE